MNILSYNIRGGGILSKRKRFSFLWNTSKVEVFLIQKSKLSLCTDVIASYFWGGNKVDWTTSNLVGDLGGMIILWKKGSLDLNYNFIGHGYVGINIIHKGKCCNLVNIYAPYNVMERRGLWKGFVTPF